MLLEDLVHSEMDPLDNVPAVVEDPANIFRVHGAGEVGVAVVGGVLPGVPLRGLKYLKKNKRFIIYIVPQSRQPQSSYHHCSKKTKNCNIK